MSDLILLCAGAAPDRADPASGALRLPAITGLATLLARGSVVSDEHLPGDPPDELPEDAWLRHCFALPAGNTVQALDGLAGGRPLPFWRLTPCYLHLGMDHAMLTDPPQLSLTLPDAQALAEAVAPSFEAQGLRLAVIDPLTWIAQGEPWDLRTWPWTMASGRQIAAYQPSGPRARDWRRLLTEVQMTWHEHPVNEAREAAGQRAINALWLDGFAAAPVPTGTGLMISSHPVLRCLARAAGWQTRDFDPLAPLTTLPEAGPVVIDPGWWREPRRLGDDSGWSTAWETFEHWLAVTGANLSQAAERGALRVVLTGERRLLQLAGSGTRRWQFWRRFDAPAALRGS